MTSPNDPAFPNGPVHMGNMEGLTKREYFAAMAMQGMMSIHPRELMNGPEKHQTVGDWIAKNCVSMADALIAELSK